MLTSLLRPQRSKLPSLIAAFRAQNGSMEQWYSTKKDLDAPPKAVRRVFLSHDETLKKKKKKSYFVFNIDANKPAEAIKLLEGCLLKTPIRVPSFGKKQCYLKIPPAAICNKILESVLSKAEINKDEEVPIEKVADLVATIQEHNVELFPSTMATLITCLAKVGQLQRGIELLDAWIIVHLEEIEDDEKVLEGPAQLMSSALKAATTIDDAHSIMAVLTRMARMGLSPGHDSMVLLLQSFMRRGDVEVAYEMLEWMERNELIPDHHHYEALLRAAPRVGKERLMLDKALELKRKRNIIPSATAYAALLNLSAEANAPDDAWRIWQAMRKENVSPDVETYLRAFKSNPKDSQEIMIERIYQEFKEDVSVAKDAVVYDRILYELARYSGENVAEEDDRYNDLIETIIKDIQQNGLELKTSALKSIVRGLLYRNHRESILELLDTKCRSLDAVERRQIYEHIIMKVQVPASIESVELVQSVLQMMEQEQLSLSTAALHGLLRLWCGTLQPKTSLGCQVIIAKKSEDLLLTEKKEQVNAANHSFTAPKLLIDTLLGIQRSETYTPRTASMENSSLPSMDDPSLHGHFIAAWRAVQGDLNGALETYRLAEKEGKENIDTEMRGWALHILLWTALESNENPSNSQVPLVVGIIREARRLQVETGWWWQKDVEEKALNFLRSSKEAEELQVQ